MIAKGDAAPEADFCDTVVLVLGDQLTPEISSLRSADRRHTLVLMAEVMEEATYVRHHKKKIALVFSAMRHFAEELRQSGWHVEYVKLDGDGNCGTLFSELARTVKNHRAKQVIVMHPGEWRLRDAMTRWQEQLGVPVRITDDDRFMCPLPEFAAWARGRRQLRMEYFYRDMRRKTGLLMEGDKPSGGRWNYDSENRKPAEEDLLLPQVAQFTPDTITQEVIDLVDQRFNDHPGALKPFRFAVTRRDAESAFQQFLQEALPGFGDFQDAMLTRNKYLYHSVISPYLNCGLLDPLAVCKAVEAEYRAGRAPLNAAEGFIRQIIGWREYVRGIYWLKMPDYAESNFFGATRALPWFYWSGKTEMACLSACIQQTLQEAYAHHIQRLMVTGTFALLAGIAPHQVHEWYLAVYADAYEWVEMPNTLGMSQFADGGLLASKPYAASGNYINKMSDYCAGCRYDVTAKSGPSACPFNYLYWDFLARHRALLERNPRLAPMYRTYDRLADGRKAEITNDAAVFLRELK